MKLLKPAYQVTINYYGYYLNNGYDVLRAEIHHYDEEKFYNFYAEMVDLYGDSFYNGVISLDKDTWRTSVYDEKIHNEIEVIIKEVLE